MSNDLRKLPPEPEAAPKAMGPRGECCELCEFWFKVPDPPRLSAPGRVVLPPQATQGACNRYPPTPFPIDAQGRQLSLWAATQPHQWCGEFLPRGVDQDKPADQVKPEGQGGAA